MLETPGAPALGDIGCESTFPFPVRYGVVPRFALERVVDRPDDALLALFIRAAADLISQGCVGITSTCSFLARWQRELTLSLTVPVLSSSLLQVPMLQRVLPHRQRVGIVIHSAIEVDTATLQAVGADAFVAVECVDPDGCFVSALRDGRSSDHHARIAAEVIAATRRLVASHTHIGAVVLESAGMSPYRDAVEAAVSVPVFGAAQLISWFYSGLRGSRVVYAHNPWR